MFHKGKKKERDNIDIINFLFVADRKGTHTHNLHIKQVICLNEMLC